MRKIFILQLFVALAITVSAQGPNQSGTYYQGANGKKGAELKTALFNIIKNHTDIGYGGLQEAYKKTDVRKDGYLRDWYSNITTFVPGSAFGSYKVEGDAYNREHLFPQSWFSEASPMKADIVHVVPADGYINNMRSNLPHGEVASVTKSSANGYSKYGPGKASMGYTGTVFEPNDEVKGDIARIYFYMATCYQDKILGWNGSNAKDVINASGTQYEPFQAWVLPLMIRWSQLDPVDDVERARNAACFDVQKNRNPFVDYPGLEDYIWGDKTNVAFTYTGLESGEGGGEGGGEDDPTTEDFVIFDAKSDLAPAGEKAGAYAIEKSGITFSCTNGIGGNGNEYRMYKSSTFSLTSTVGNITKIVFVKNGSSKLSDFGDPEVGVFDEDTWTGSAPVVNFGELSAQVRLNSLTVYFESTVPVEKVSPELAFSQTAYTVYEDDDFTPPTLSYAQGFNGKISYSSTNPSVAAVDAATGEVTIGTQGETCITAYTEGTAKFSSQSVSYTITVRPRAIEVAEGNVFWSEDFSGYKKDDVPQGGEYDYVCVKGGSATKIFEENLASGTSPEILVSKSNGSFTATVDLKGWYGVFELSFKSNNTNNALTVNGSEVKLATNDKLRSGNFTVAEGTTSLTITISNTKSSNTRIDDILLRGTQVTTTLDEDKPLMALAGIQGTVNLSRTVFDGWNTLVLPFATTAAQLMRALEVEEVYSYAGMDGSTLLFESVTNDVEAGQPLLVKAARTTEEKSSYVLANIVMGSEAEAQPLTDTGAWYELQGTYRPYDRTTSPVTALDYVLSTTSFKRAAGQNTLKAYRAYLRNMGDADANARELVISLDNTANGITLVETAESTQGAVYDLQGRIVRPAQQSAPGNLRPVIYIINGKKTIVK